MPAWLRRRRVPALVAALVVVAGVVTWLVLGRAGGVHEIATVVDRGGHPDVRLDTSIFVPDGVDAAHPAPAIIVGHGFGGSKQSVRADAEYLAGQGYVVLTYSSRGFGHSGGLIGLDAPDAEVADARAMIDLLAARPDVLQDGPHDPRVGITGASYGGALALLAAGYDHRVDAIVPMITWNSLASAFFPQSVGAPAGSTPAAGPVAGPPGVFKKLWAGIFFGTGNGLSQSLTGSADGAPLGPAAAPAAGGVSAAGLTCSRFVPALCDLYATAATTGRLDPAGAALLQRSSPASVLDRITAPTLLVQGEADTLFPLSEADANARGIAAAGGTVRVVWYSGGHDAGTDDDDTAYLHTLTAEWFDHYLKHQGAAPSIGFQYAQDIGLSTRTGRATSRTSVADAYPGLVSGATDRGTVALRGPDQPIANPPGGNPAAVSSIPGVSGITSAVGVAIDPPGQAAYFQSAPLTTAVQLVGAPTVRLRVASATGSAVLFVKLYDVDGAGGAVLPQGLVAPVRLTGLPPTLAGAAPIEVTLPAVAHRFEPGHRLRLAVASSDQAYLTPNDPAVYQIGLDPAAAAISLPTVHGVPADSGLSPWIPFFAVLAGLALLGLLGGLLWRRRTRAREVSDVDAELVDVPLVISGLRKVYADGFVAVRELSLRVERNQVVGLLGPNGAGKTTTLRVLMGLIRPTVGTVRVFGHQIVAGAEVLARVGCFVEGVGFLPHLSGRDNLRLYWQATGRPTADARLDEALQIAGLGTAIDRKVRTYSQGMRQRLAIAQAMLGLPDLLVLDEPTNGLDPPQIAEMRGVLRRYARDGRTVLVSSHQLAEVEQTCTHVVVMHHGELVAQGGVAEIVGVGNSVLFGVDDPDAAERLLRSVHGVSDVQRTDDGVLADLDGIPRADLVRRLVGAGVGVQRVAPQRRLEDAFLALVGEDKP